MATYPRWLPLAILVGMFLFGFVLCGTYVFLADKLCPLETIPTPSPLQHLLWNYRNDGEQKRGQGRNWSGTHEHDSPGLALATLVFAQAAAKESERREQTSNEHGKTHRWIVKFFCEAKAADIALVFFTYGLMVVTGWLAWATLKLWRADEKQMELVAEANRISHATMVADQRPWITANDPQLVNDLEFYNWGADFVMNVKFTNIGKSPASRIRVHMEMRKSSEGLRDAIERLAESEKDDASPWTRILLPNEYFRREGRFNLDTTPPHGGRIYPVIIGCVTYKIPQDEELHQTAFVLYPYCRIPITGRERSIGVWEGQAAFKKEEIDWDSGSGGFAT